ncbi:SPFH domain-containing protein [Geothrix fermentans]|jgi:regulator of protease activity HflC (stomatin/prohibitin superfamily)|uniref:SPFH domain-containing protein n=1 Tax=Geothrix fermentans TaxID=44676 RepID=UPI0005BC24F9
MEVPVLKERTAFALPGLPTLLLTLLALLGAVGLTIQGVLLGDPARLAYTVPVIVVGLFVLTGLFVVNPNEAMALQLFGAYRGTVRQEGMAWANPFLSKRKISTKVRSFESQRLKVNDQDGNPVEIAAIIVWRVVDTAEALFEVEDCEKYVTVQSEAALRALASHFPYDAHETGQLSLRGSTDEVAAKLKQELQRVLAQAGVEVQGARISHLAYAPEIAQAMLQRQQAAAIIAARQKIVEGAVGMVEMALAMLAEKGTVQLDEERKAAMVSNLLVVLCSERSANPVVNAGTLYH